jgi:colanic acid biosynthesis glycosyl transferase WcaI
VRILVVSNLFHPDRGGGASVFSDLCFGLAERGHDVTVYAAYPYYPEWTNKAHANLWRVSDEQLHGLRVRRFGLYIPKNPSKLGPRLAFELSYAVSLLRSLAYRERFDAVMVFCPVMGAVAYTAARRLVYRETTWLNVQDIPADAAASSGIASGRLGQRIGQRAQSLVFNSADVWSTIAPKMVERLEVLRRRDQPIHLVPNFLNGSMAAAIAEHPSKLGRPVGTPPRLLYAGTIGKKQDLLACCRRLASLELDFRFRIHGSGGEAAHVRDWIATSGDPRFEFGSFLDEPAYVAALYETDVFVITEREGVGASFMPSKLIPCIATGTPVLGVCDGDGPLGREIADFGLGAVVQWPEIDQLERCLREICDDAETFRDHQRAALERSTSYARDTVISFVERELTAGLTARARA